VVFGDIGTSPLYTLKTVLGLTGEIMSSGFPIKSQDFYPR
jgi:K+ transporter